MAGPTGGYLLGYLLAAVACGWLAERGWDRNILSATIALLIGNALIYVPGLLWLGTVPLTGGLVAQIFGPTYMSMLYGIVFFSHQIGSFLGAWLGGYVFDATGSYALVWIATAVAGLVAALLHFPIDDAPVPAARPVPGPAAAE